MIQNVLRKMNQFMLQFYNAPGSHITLSLPLIRMVKYSILISLKKGKIKFEPRIKLHPQHTSLLPKDICGEANNIHVL